MFGECHAHLFMNGYDYRRAVNTHKNSPDEMVIRKHLQAYQDAGVTFIRDGGDIYGVSLLARRIAPEYDITYLTPGFAIHKAGTYGSVVGKSYETLADYRELLKEIKMQGGDFVKIMTTGILDFANQGQVTGTLLPRDEVKALVEQAHDAGFKVMAHTNTAQAVIIAAETGVDSIEHGNYQTAESVQAMKEYKTTWIPTVVTIKNLMGCGRFDDAVLNQIWETQKLGLRMAWRAGVSMALGSDAGAFMVPHGIGICDEYQAFCKVLGESEALQLHLQTGEERIRTFHR